MSTITPCIHELFEANVREMPDALAVISGPEKLTYRELDARGNRLARYLLRHGIGPESPVGVCVDRSCDLVAALLAILKAGGVYVPLDPSYPLQRLNYILDDAHVEFVLMQQGSPEGIQRGRWRTLYVDQDGDEITVESGDHPDVPMSSLNLAYIIYTSGSSGTPKGVMVQHSGIANIVREQSRIFGATSADRILQFSSPSFDASVFEIIMALGTGATLYLTCKEKLLLGMELAELLREQKISIVTLPPSVLLLMPAVDLPDLRTILVAGEECPAELARQWSIGRNFLNLYGPTETTIWATAAQYAP
jgi:amino acid adenylation domain-containing protein